MMIETITSNPKSLLISMLGIKVGFYAWACLKICVGVLAAQLYLEMNPPPPCITTTSTTTSTTTTTISTTTTRAAAINGEPNINAVLGGQLVWDDDQGWIRTGVVVGPSAGQSGPGAIGITAEIADYLENYADYNPDESDYGAEYSDYYYNPFPHLTGGPSGPGGSSGSSSGSSSGPSKTSSSSSLFDDDHPFADDPEMLEILESVKRLQAGDSIITTQAPRTPFFTTPRRPTPRPTTPIPRTPAPRVPYGPPTKAYIDSNQGMIYQATAASPITTPPAQGFSLDGYKGYNSNANSYNSNLMTSLNDVMMTTLMSNSTTSTTTTTTTTQKTKVYTKKRPKRPKLKEGIPTKKKNGIPKPTKESATEAITEELSTIAQEIRVGSNVGFNNKVLTFGKTHFRFYFRCYFKFLNQIKSVLLAI